MSTGGGFRMATGVVAPPTVLERTSMSKHDSAALQTAATADCINTNRIRVTVIGGVPVSEQRGIGEYDQEWNSESGL